MTLMWAFKIEKQHTFKLKRTDIIKPSGKRMIGKTKAAASGEKEKSRKFW